MKTLPVTARLGHAPGVLAVVAHRRNATNGELAERGAVVVSPAAASRTLCASDVALGRIDVRRDLAGIEFGITALRRLERSGVTVLNPATPCPHNLVMRVRY